MSLTVNVSGRGEIRDFAVSIHAAHAGSDGLHLNTTRRAAASSSGVPFPSSDFSRAARNSTVREFATLAITTERAISAVPAEAFHSCSTRSMQQEKPPVRLGLESASANSPVAEVDVPLNDEVQKSVGCDRHPALAERDLLNCPEAFGVGPSLNERTLTCDISNPDAKN